MVGLPYVAGVFQPSGVPGESQLALTDGWTDGVLFEAQKTMFFGNISKNKKYFFMVVFAPPSRVFNTTFVKISKVF